MSLDIRILPGEALEMNKYLPQDEFTDKDYVTVKSRLSSFKLPIPADLVIPFTKIDKLLYHNEEVELWSTKNK